MFRTCLAVCFVFLFASQPVSSERDYAAELEKKVLIHTRAAVDAYNDLGASVSSSLPVEDLFEIERARSRLHASLAFSVEHHRLLVLVGLAGSKDRRQAYMVLAGALDEESSRLDRAASTLSNRRCIQILRDHRDALSEMSTKAKSIASTYPPTEETPDSLGGFVEILKALHRLR